MYIYFKPCFRKRFVIKKKSYNGYSLQIQFLKKDIKFERKWKFIKTLLFFIFRAVNGFTYGC